MRELWTLWLTFRGFHVDEARNGREAVQKAQTCRPDLVLMDVWMPVVDGLEAMRRLKADDRTAHLPVGLIPKPCDADALLEHIRAALRGVAS